MVNAQELLRTADVCGAVSETQLLRWQREAIVPAPRRRGLGRGQGVRMEYPEHAAAQLTAAAALRPNVQGYPQLRLELWLAGFDVPWQRIRDDLVHALQPWAEYFEGLRTAIAQWQSGRDEDALDDLIGEASLALASGRHGAARVFPGWRRLHSEADRQSFMWMGMLGVFNGKLPAGMGHEKLPDNDELTYGGLMARAMNLDKLDTSMSSKKPADDLLDEASSLGMLNAQHLLETVHTATEEELLTICEVIRQYRAVPQLQAFIGRVTRRNIGEFAALVGALVASLRAQQLAAGTPS